jgi:tetratricopeptide (TPR) repeat protein
LKPAALAEPIFVGRDRELEQLQKYLNSAIESKGKTVFISGEAGAGKTKLANEFLNLAKKSGIKVISGWCMSKAAVPYFPFVEAFSIYLASVRDKSLKVAVTEQLGITGWLKGAEVVTVAEQLGIRGWLKGPKHERKIREHEILSAEIKKDMTFAAATKVLLSISAEEPVILFIEDLHWADSASISLLHYISRAIVSSRILIVVTFRREELPPDSEGHPHPLVETLRLMNREDLYNEIEVSSLGQHDVAKLAESMVGGKVDPELIERLAKESQGNPLFAVECLRMLFESGNLNQENGRWCLSAGHVEIPAKVKDVILHRLGMLNRNQRRILELASVVGEKFDPGLVGTVLSLDKLLVLENLHAITQSAFLINPEDSVYRFGHAKFREILYEEISAPLKREYHSRVAESIESFFKTADECPVNDLAFHYARAGNKEKAIRYGIAAGEDCLKRFSNLESAQHFAYVLKAIAEDSKYKNEKTVALEGLGDAYSAMSAFEEATRTFEQLNEVSEAGGVRLRALRKAMTSAFNRGDFTHALELASKANKDSSFDALEYARVRMYRAKTHAFRGDIPRPDVLRDLEDCLQTFEERHSIPDVAEALQEIGTLYLTDSRFDEALNNMVRSIKLYEQLGDSRKQMEAYFWLANIYFFTGLHQEALDSFEKVIQIGERIGEYNRMAWARLYSGLLYESMGELKEMLEHTLKALQYSEKTDSYYIQSAAYGNMARGYAKLGDLKCLEEYFAKFTVLFADASRTSSKLIRAVGARTQAVRLAAICQWDEANEHFEQCLKLYEGSLGSTLHEIMARSDYAWALVKQGRNAEARAQIEAALELCHKIGNKTQIARLNSILAETKSA